MEINSEIEFHVVRWPVNKEAPFEFDLSGVIIYERGDYSNEELLVLSRSVNPNLIISSGWIDKGYVAVCKAFYGKVKTVLALDNHWVGNVKQKIAASFSKFLIRNKFSNVWVPGEPQYQFARKLGYSNSEITKGFYSADVELFNNYFQQFKEYKKENFPKVFLYVGRYVRHKGIFDMWEAFIELQEKNADDWELWCVGTGDEFENRILHEKIKHIGFLQPNEFGDIIKKSAVYILPSHFEPWGVSLHEFCAAGFPLLCSTEVGSSEQFLVEGENGFKFESNNVSSIKNAMRKIMESSENELLKMQEKSFELSLLVSPATWSQSLFDLINNNITTNKK